MLRKVTNSLYENILCLTLKWFTINKSVYIPLSENKEKRAEIDKRVDKLILQIKLVLVET